MPQLPSDFSEFPILEVPNNANGTNSTTPGILDETGLNKLVHLWMVLVVLGIALVVIGLMFGAFTFYRKRAHKKIDEAGKMTINVTRGGR